MAPPHRHNPVIAAFYQRLCVDDKPMNLALIACIQNCWRSSRPSCAMRPLARSPALSRQCEDLSIETSPPHPTPI
jgi:hypothetical protein